MIKEVWRGYLFDGKRVPLIEVRNGTYIKIQGKGQGGTATLRGTISEDASLSPIGLIRCSDLAKRKKILTEEVYMADVSGYRYVSVQSNGFNSVYAVIYGDDDIYEPGEYEEHEYKAVIILNAYKALIPMQEM